MIGQVREGLGRGVGEEGEGEGLWQKNMQRNSKQQRTAKCKQPLVKASCIAHSVNNRGSTALQIRPHVLQKHAQDAQIYLLLQKHLSLCWIALAFRIQA